MRDDENFWTKKRLIAAAVAGLLVFVVSTFFVCFNRVAVEAGQEAVLIDKPYFFGHGGVNKTPVTAGAVWVWRTTHSTVVDIRPVQYKEAFDDVMTADNVPVDFNAFAKIQVKTGQGPVLLEKFGATWYENNLKQIVRTEVRDAVARHPMTALTTRADVLTETQKNIYREVDAFIKKSGLPVVLNEIIVEKVVPPKEIVDALASTAAQQQRAKTEIERAKAEEQRKDAEAKRAVADNAYRNALNLTPDQFVQLEGIKAYATACKDGDCTIIVGGGVNTTLPLKK